MFSTATGRTLVPMIAKAARLVVWPGVGAETANMNYVDMQPGERNVPHVHRESEDTIFILDGRGSIEDLTNDSRLEFEAGQVYTSPLGCGTASRRPRVANRKRGRPRARPTTSCCAAGAVLDSDP